MTLHFPADILIQIKDLLSGRAGSEVELRKFTKAGGGCINHGGRLETSVGSFFLKWNRSHDISGMFEAEAQGLYLLTDKSSLGIPRVIGHQENDSTQFLILSYIDEGKKAQDYWEKLGEGLAELHKNSATQFGLDHDNFIGSLRQENKQVESWIEFFIYKRLETQLDLAQRKGLADKQLRNNFLSLYKALPDILIEDAPSLLHGDLWSGNIMANTMGEPVLIDPAVYFGHREMDLAMTKLFGGFPPSFYSSYNEFFPLEKNVDERIMIYTLYPLLVHVNLFGEGYLAQVRTILNQFL